MNSLQRNRISLASQVKAGNQMSDNFNAFEKAF